MAQGSMGEKVLGFLSRFLPQAGPPFDPAVFGDPLAGRTSWSPLVAGGSNFCSHRLKVVDSMTLEFKMTFGMKAFCFVFAGMGALFAVGPLASMYKHYGGFHLAMLPFFLFGLLFFGLGIGVYYFSDRPIVFDLKRSCFYKGRRAARASSPRRGEIVVDLGRIRALQVLSEYCRGNKSSFYSYELNLVLDDAGRVNVVDHGGLDALRQDAQVLGHHLGVPVWDMEVARTARDRQDPGPFPEGRDWPSK